MELCRQSEPKRWMFPVPTTVQSFILLHQQVGWKKLFTEPFTLTRQEYIFHVYPTSFSHPLYPLSSSPTYVEGKRGEGVRVVLATSCNRCAQGSKTQPSRPLHVQHQGYDSAHSSNLGNLFDYSTTCCHIVGVLIKRKKVNLLIPAWRWFASPSPYQWVENPSLKQTFQRLVQSNMISNWHFYLLYYL